MFRLLSTNLCLREPIIRQHWLGRSPQLPLVLILHKLSWTVIIDESTRVLHNIRVSTWSITVICKWFCVQSGWVFTCFNRVQKWPSHHVRLLRMIQAAIVLQDVGVSTETVPPVRSVLHVVRAEELSFDVRGYLWVGNPLTRGATRIRRVADAWTALNLAGYLSHWSF